MVVTNGIPLINGQEFSWADIICIIGGTPIAGITSIEYDDKQEKKNNYGAGKLPVSRSKGKIECSAKITISMKEALALQQKAITNRLQDIAPFNIQVSYLQESGLIVNDIIKDCEFLENVRKWKEGDTDTQIELPLIVSKIEWNGNQL